MRPIVMPTGRSTPIALCIGIATAAACATASTPGDGDGKGPTLITGGASASGGAAGKAGAAGTGAAGGGTGATGGTMSPFPDGGATTGGKGGAAGAGGTTGGGAGAGGGPGAGGAIAAGGGAGAAGAGGTGVCTAMCAGKQCGPDGCPGIGVCGTCPGGQACNAQGACVPTACVPMCTGKQCGPDGCNLGGVCGTCAGGQTCNGGACVCVPQCAGKTCGPDGCGAACGPACATGQACMAGTCQSTTLPTWTTAIPGATFGGLALDPGAGGLVYVAGAVAATGWLGAIDPGTGAVLTSTAVGPSNGALNVVRFAGGALLTGGWADTGGANGAEGAFQSFAPGTLSAVSGYEPLYGGAMFDEVRDVAQTASLIWMVGTSSTATSNGTGSPWGIYQTANVGACGYPLLPGPVNGAARAVAIVGASTYVLILADSQALVARYDAMAGCVPTQTGSAPLVVGTTSTVPTGMVVLGNVAYVVGNADSGGGVFGFIAAVDLGSMTMTGNYHDIVGTRRFSSIGTDGSALCIGGKQGATGYIGKWTTSFGSAWAAGGALPKGTDDVRGVACDGSSFYAASVNGGLAKCTAAGDCG